MIDPPVREDGRCFVCLKDRKPERSRRYAGDIAEFDPFCSMPCARAFYGCSLPEVPRNGRPKRLEAA